MSEFKGINDVKTKIEAVLMQIQQRLKIKRQHEQICQLDNREQRKAKPYKSD